MVDSADEPPLLSRVHSWAKAKIFLPFNFSRTSKQEETSPATTGVLPQHAGYLGSGPGAPATTTDDTIRHQDTVQSNSSTVDTAGEGEKPTAIGDTEEAPASVYSRFVRDVKRIVGSSWINWLLLIVPIAIGLGAVQDWGHKEFVNPSVIFALNAVAIIPLASLLAFATENVAVRLGDTVGALLNVTFGNAVEIIIFVIALVANEIRIVQAALVGSILSNLLLILGMAFVLGGLRFREQLYNPSVGQMSACLLSLSMVSLLLPTAFHAAFADNNAADRAVLKVSRGTSVILLLVYCLYLVFQLKSHAFMYESTPQHIIDEESHPGVLADMLNNSSSSSSESSSSSDSDSSHHTAQRIKRALRRKRRKSTASQTTSIPTLNRVPAIRTSSPRADRDAVSSGDEADGESGLPHRSSESNVVSSLDPENNKEAGLSEKRSRRRKSKKSKHVKVIEASEKTPATVVEIPGSQSISPRPGVEIDLEKQNTNVERHPRRPFHFRELSRDLSTVVRPAFNSTVFPHHEAAGRSLVVPGARLECSRPTAPAVRRTSSMPDISRNRSPAPQPAGSNARLTPLNVPVDIPIEEVWNPNQHLSRTSSVILLLCTTALVALCAEFLVGSINYMVSSSGVSQAFIGLIILPIVGNAAEHVTALTVAYKNKMDLAVNIALGSSIQIALFVTPLTVMLGWAMKVDMSLYFNLFETVSLFASAFIVNYLMIDGRTNYLEGTLLIAAYVIIAIAAFFYPTCSSGATLC